MQNNFNARFYSNGGGWSLDTWTSSAFTQDVDVLLFLNYPPWNWQAVEEYGNMTVPAIPFGIAVPNLPTLRFDVGGAPLITPAEIPEIGEQSYGPTVTNGVQVRGYYGRIIIPGRDWENGGNPASLNLRTFGQAPGGTVQSQNFTGRADSGVYRAAIIPETEYTQQMQDDGNRFEEAGPTIYSVVGIYS